MDARGLKAAAGVSLGGRQLRVGTACLRGDHRLGCVSRRNAVLNAELIASLIAVVIASGVEAGAAVGKNRRFDARDELTNVRGLGNMVGCCF